MIVPRAAAGRDPPYPSTRTPPPLAVVGKRTEKASPVVFSRDGKVGEKGDLNLWLGYLRFAEVIEASVG